MKNLLFFIFDNGSFGLYVGDCRIIDIGKYLCVGRVIVVDLNFDIGRCN